MTSSLEKKPEPGRRQFLRKGILGVLGGLLSGKAFAQQKASSPGSMQAGGEALTTHMRKGEPPVQPLDTMVLFERGDDNNGPAQTHEVLSLIHQEKGKKSFPWTLYASLETHHVEGDACVVCSRLHKHERGWSSGVHSEVFNHAPAVALGMNIEMNNDYAGEEGTQVIGLNIQATKGPRPMQYGIQIHDNHEGADAYFEKGIGLNGFGKAGLDVAGKYEVGIDAHKNSIRVAEGTCIELEETGKIRLRYRAGRIEFLNGDKCFGHLDVNGEDHAL